MPEIGVSSTVVRRRIAQRAAGQVSRPRGRGGDDRRAWALPRGGRGVSAAGQGAEREAAVAERHSEELDRSPTLARRIATIVDDKKGEEIVALDVRELVGYTDYLVIATARNERQAKAIHDEVQLRLKQGGSAAAGAVGGRWRGALGAAGLPRLRAASARARDARALPARAPLGRGRAARARARGRG